MHSLVRIAGAVLAAATIASLAAPAAAQPLRVTVTDPRVIEPPLLQPPSGRLVRPSALFDYHPRIGRDFDPGLAALDSQVFSRSTEPVDPVRAAVLDRHGISLAEHQLRCQSLHPTYELVSNTYLDRNGIPQACVY